MRLLSVAFYSLLAACGGRAAHPVPLEKSYDDRLSCSHLAGEYENNLKRLEELTGESREKFRNNAGLLVFNPLFLDLSDNLKLESEAILARNERLMALMATKDCPAVSPQEGGAAKS